MGARKGISKNWTGGVLGKMQVILAGSQPVEPPKIWEVRTRAVGPQPTQSSALPNCSVWGASSRQVLKEEGIEDRDYQNLCSDLQEKSERTRLLLWTENCTTIVRLLKEKSYFHDWYP